MRFPSLTPAKIVHVVLACVASMLVVPVLVISSLFVRSEWLDNQCRRIEQGDPEVKIFALVGAPTSIRHCGADGYVPDPIAHDELPACAKEYWFSTHIFGGGWIIWVDDHGRVIDTARLVLP
jgi:hypothetical protein